MDGLEAVEIKFSDAVHDNDSLRFDSEFFKKEFNLIQEAIGKRSPEKLSELTTWITQGPNPVFVEAGIPSLNGRNVASGRVEFHNSSRVSEEEYRELVRFQVKRHDILMTLKGKGSIGKIGFVFDAEQGIFSRDIGLIRVKPDRIRSAYLHVFLNSAHGKMLVARGETGGTGQTTLTTSYLKKILVPRLGIEAEIAELLHSSEQLYSSSQAIYNSAEAVLLEHLGLKDWQPSDAGVSVKSFAESFGSSARLDAEHYQPKYDELIDTIRVNAPQHKQIKEFRTYNARGLQPEYVADGQLDVINSRHILEQHLDYENFERTDLVAWQEQAKARVLENDILTYTTGANIGRTNVYLRSQHALASNHVNILRVANVDPIYVGFVMNSVIGRLQTEKLSAGSAQAELYPKDIDEFLIPFIDESAQQQIVLQVKASLEAKEQSQQLLEIAKRGVELAIEESEADATTWIKERLANLRLSDSAIG